MMGSCSKIKQNRLIKHQLFTSDVDVESWLKFLNIEGLFYFTMIVCFALR